MTEVISTKKEAEEKGALIHKVLCIKVCIGLDYRKKVSKYAGVPGPQKR